MIRFHAFSALQRPGLHVWRRNSPLSLDARALPQAASAPGWHVFECEIDTAIPDSVRCLLFEWDEHFENAARRRCGSLSRVTAFWRSPGAAPASSSPS